jgi:PAS domain S-box-containing protein
MMTKIIPGNTKRSRWPWPAGALFLFVLLAVMAWNRNLANKSAAPLTAEEKTWLKAHPVIRLAPDPDFPPVEYFVKDGEYSGITADYVALLEKKLGIRFEIVPLRDWNQIINKAKSRQIDVVVASATPQRAEYMLFTKPFLELPAVIIAREKVRGPLSLEKLSGMRVSVVSGYATHDFIAGNFPKLRIDPVPDVRTGLRKISFGLSDAFVENLASASYYIEKEGITNLRISGESGYSYRMSFCSRKDWPELNSILEKGLAGISADEKKAIYKKWIPLEPWSLFTSREFQTGLLAAFAAILAIAAGVIAWNRALARQVMLRTGELEKELAERRVVEGKLRFTQFAVDNSSEYAFWMTEDGRIFYVNDAACRALGYSRDELLRMTTHDIAPCHPPEVFAEHWQNLRERGSLTHESYHRAKDGRVYPVEIHDNMVVFDGKEYNCAYMTDISERKRMQDELERARDELEKRVLERTAELTRTTEALIAVEQEKSLFLNVTDALVVYYDLEMNILWANRAACESVKMPQKKLQQRHCWEMWHKRREPCTGCPVILARDTGESREGEVRSPDGRVWFIRSYPVKDKTGRITGIVEFCQDFTERKQAEEALREANLVMENSPVVLFRCKPVPGWPVELVSRNVVQFGYTPEEFLSGKLTYSSIVYPQDLEKVAAETEEFAATGEEQLRQEYRIVTKKGEVRWIIDETNCERNEEGEITHFEGIIIDVTERKLAEDALREANMVVENSPVVLFRWKASDEWPVELVSTNIIQFGYEPDEFLSGSITYSSIIHPDDLERVTRKAHDFCNEQTDQFRLEYRIITKWGNVRWVNEHSNIERDAAGVVSNFEGIVIDITERKLAEEKLQRKKQLLQELNDTLERRVEDEVEKNRKKDIMLIQQNRQAALGEMLDHIAHQWKQPLNSISLIVQEMAYSSSDGELTDEHVQATNGTIMSLLDHMAQTIDVFRGFYRPDKKTKVFSVKESIDQALAFIAPTFRFQSIAVELDVDPGLTGFGYPREYTQVFLNILANAKDAFRARRTENGTVIIKAFAESTKTVVTITDNAGGIPEAIIDKIFDFYFTTNEAAGGTGIGLYMSKNIIEKNMSGTLSAENTGSGARFRIEIPSA